jgi:hypothetical protein
MMTSEIKVGEEYACAFGAMPSATIRRPRLARRYRVIRSPEWLIWHVMRLDPETGAEIGPSDEGILICDFHRPWGEQQRLLGLD